MLVSDLMKTEVATVSPDDTIIHAARIMLTHHVSGLPVLESDRLTGIVTEGDMLRRAEIGTEGKAGWFKSFFLPDRLANDYVHTHGLHVRDVMTASPTSVTPATGLAQVADIMSRQGIKRLPVLDNGKLVGVISRTDMLQLLSLRLAEACDPLTESEIRDHILATLASEKWAPKSGIRVTVTGNVVDLQGVVFSANEQKAVRVIAEMTPGVKEIHDHMVYVDPGSGLAFPIT